MLTCSKVGSAPCAPRNPPASAPKAPAAEWQCPARKRSERLCSRTRSDPSRIAFLYSFRPLLLSSSAGRRPNNHQRQHDASAGVLQFWPTARLLPQTSLPPPAAAAGAEIVRPSARAHLPVHDRDVGALLLLRDALAACALHDEISPAAGPLPAMSSVCCGLKARARRRCSARSTCSRCRRRSGAFIPGLVYFTPIFGGLLADRVLGRAAPSSSARC